MFRRACTAGSTAGVALWAGGWTQQARLQGCEQDDPNATAAILSKRLSDPPAAVHNKPPLLAAAAAAAAAVCSVPATTSGTQEDNPRLSANTRNKKWTFREIVENTAIFPLEDHEYEVSESEADLIDEESCEIYGEITLEGGEMLAEELVINKTDHFADLGSGAGKLPMLIHSVSGTASSVGVELSGERHNMGVRALAELRQVSLYLSIYLPIYLSTYLPIYLSIYLI